MCFRCIQRHEEETNRKDVFHSHLHHFQQVYRNDKESLSIYMKPILQSSPEVQQELDSSLLEQRAKKQLMEVKAIQTKAKVRKKS